MFFNMYDDVINTNFKNMVQIKYKGKVYTGYILTMDSTLNHSTDILSVEEFWEIISYEIELLPFDTQLNKWLSNERVSIIIHDLAEIKSYNGV